ncbi:TlpA disulfide reductase family protein [Dokdonia sp. Dokd-P16]|uniref:TlpA disulfide reductase family protein n=1 Tax=Dokdonia sp. Dokd-P16 TaxID=2173169 RepID=UPI0013A5942A|nr:TlpA disulfide reductase family protein [Dokdonia sp. Dokd-P16]
MRKEKPVATKFKTILLRIFFVIVSVFLLSVSCKNDKTATKVDSFNLSVQAKNFPDSTKVVLYNRDIDKDIDSGFAVNERFDFSGTVALPSLSYLNFYDKNGKPLEPYKYFFLENTNMSVIGEYSDFLNAKVTGSEQTDLYTVYNALSQDSDTSNRFQKEVDFLYANANNQMALTELLYKKKQISKDSLLLFYEKLDTINTNSIKGQELLTYTKAIDIKAGDSFRDIKGTDLEGKQHKLSDYAGKVILLDFWAAGCRPCRLQNKKEFPELIKKYSKDDFVLISYSLDTDKKSWKQSSEKDNINWLNISDLQGMKGDNVSKYAVTAIPNSFLINQEGIIVRSFIGFTDGSNTIEKEINKLLE